MGDDGITYSRVVGWLKIGLPLAALALLSTLFLFAKDRDGSGNVPFAQGELEKKANEETISNAQFFGHSDKGHSIELSAQTAKPDQTNPAIVFAQGVKANIGLNSGGRIRFSSENAVVDQIGKQATLTENVVINSTDGYTIRTEGLVTHLEKIEAQSTAPVTADGHGARLEAGKVELSEIGPEKTPYLFFTNGVKLVYTPKS